MTSEDRLVRIERRLTRLEALLGDPRVVRALLGLIAALFWDPVAARIARD